MPYGLTVADKDIICDIGMNLNFGQEIYGREQGDPDDPEQRVLKEIPSFHKHEKLRP